MTSQDAGAEVINEPALRRRLASHLPGLRTDEAIDIALLPGGRSNLTYRLTQGSRRWALRRPPLGHVLESAHDVGREFRVMTGLHRAGYPVPRTRWWCDAPEALELAGAPFFVMDFVDGEVFATSADTASLDPAQAGALSLAQTDGLADLHQVDLEAAGLISLGRPGGFVSRQLRRWQTQWLATKTRELPAIERLGGWLEANQARVPIDAPATLVHGDFRLDNLIVDPTSLSIAAVVDWELATVGDPLADLAVALIYWTEVGDGLRATVPVAERATAQPGFWSRDQVATHYLDRSGRSAADLDVYLALGCLKLAVIMESIRARSLSGLQLGVAAGGADTMGRACEALAELGLAASRTRGPDSIQALST